MQLKSSLKPTRYVKMIREVLVDSRLVPVVLERRADLSTLGSLKPGIEKDGTIVHPCWRQLKVKTKNEKSSAYDMTDNDARFNCIHCSRRPALYD